MKFLSAVVLATAGLTLASGAGAAAAPPADRTQQDTTFVGLFTEHGSWNWSDTDAFIGATGVTPSAHVLSSGWATDSFAAVGPQLDAIHARGMQPLLYWEPWDHRAPEPRSVQPDYQLGDIIDGSHDAYIRSWARGIRDLGYPVTIRFAHEMNGSWYPWAEGVNGNQPGEYAQAWRHVVRIFEESGAGNVTWVWSPNVSYPGSTPYRGLYPGTNYVDRAGVSGYYVTGGRSSFAEVFDASLDELKRVTRKPVIITETAASDASGRQAELVTDLFAGVLRRPEVVGVVWFEVAKEEDWRIAPRPASAQAFREAVSDPRFELGGR